MTNGFAMNVMVSSAGPAPGKPDMLSTFNVRRRVRSRLMTLCPLTCGSRISVSSRSTVPSKTSSASRPFRPRGPDTLLRSHAAISPRMAGSSSTTRMVAPWRFSGHGPPKEKLRVCGCAQQSWHWSTDGRMLPRGVRRHSRSRESVAACPQFLQQVASLCIATKGGGDDLRPPPLVRLLPALTATATLAAEGRRAAARATIGHGILLPLCFYSFHPTGRSRLFPAPGTT